MIQLQSPRLCLWPLPLHSHLLSLPSVSHNLHLLGNKTNSGSHLTIQNFPQKCRLKPLSSPQACRLSLPPVLFLTLSQTGCPLPRQYSQTFHLPSRPGLQPVSQSSQMAPVTAASSPGSQQSDRSSMLIRAYADMYRSIILCICVCLCTKETVFNYVCHEKASVSQLHKSRCLKYSFLFHNSHI